MAQKYIMPKYCNAVMENGEKCRRPAGWGTDHPGSGRCKWHGGINLKQTMYLRAAKWLPKELIRDCEKLKKKAELAQTLETEITLLQVKSLRLETWLLDHKHLIGKGSYTSTQRLLTTIYDTIGKLRKQQNVIEQQNKHYLTLDNIKSAMEAWIKVVLKYVKDTSALRKMMEEYKILSKTLFGKDPTVIDAEVVPVDGDAEPKQLTGRATPHDIQT